VAARALIVIWMLASELPSPGTAAMTSATHDALGPDSEVRAELLPEGDAMNLAKAERASGVVRVSWESDDHRRVRVLCYVPALDRVIDRELVFSASDPELERGRTLGFLVASIFIDAGVVAPPRVSVEQPRPPEATPAPDSLQDKSQKSAPSNSRWAIGAAAQLSGPGTATGFGAWLGLERSLGDLPLWFGGSFQARFGTVPEAQASSRFLALGPHATWLFAQPSTRSWLGVRGGASLAQLSIARLSDSDVGGPERRTRFLAAFELLLHAGYDFTPGSALAVDFGGELLSGKTQIFLRQREVARWPLLVPTLRVGVNSTF
jgi:hypothetical protein